MKIGKIVKLLWRQHRWEFCLFVGVSLLLSGLFWKDTGREGYAGLAWLELATLAWLVTRVALSQGGFGTFGGWRARPCGRGKYLFAEVMFLSMALLIAVIPRLVVAVEILQPTADDWSVLVDGWKWSLISVGVLYGGCRLLGLGWEQGDARARPSIAWGVVLTMTAGTLVISSDWNRNHGNIGKGQSYDIDPRGIPGVKDGQWLRGRYNHAAKAELLDLMKLPFVEGESASRKGVRVELVELKEEGESYVINLEVTSTGSLVDGVPPQVGFLLAFPNGYYGSKMTESLKGHLNEVALLDVNRMSYRARLVSPLVLPENELSSQELRRGAELWVSVDEALYWSYRDDRGQRKIPKSDKEGLRWFLAGREKNAKEKKTFLGELNKQGRDAMADVLEAFPWSEWGFYEIVKPYLVKVAALEDQPRLLAFLKRDPLMGDVFLEKNWMDVGEPIMREHLLNGKTLSKKQIVYFSKVRDPSMGALLENQLLRLSGDFDAVSIAVRDHPAVDWDRVRAEAWKRLESGFDSHWVWVQWGAEMGEKEALRRLLVEARLGKKWERGILESWFGKKGGLLKQLHENWEQVKFEGGKWTLAE